ncbi:prolipoprotein diacylglyceryl transferase [Haloechinothrix sp. YIM 98757]|uniref:Phosphatidylglycerol--prolipoprotein diacylglyceryl transferase n=1 Tax=Haloechinothrix aidingensis TaxID=2752311 RepID=A0A837ZYC1_9PSEU|nr:prolipoprotein diacylglyceryl transferase [Haloechinothrix aidingensis]
MTYAAQLFHTNIPSPVRGVWEIGPVPIRAYALCIIAGIIIAILWGERRWAARGGERGLITDIAVFAVPFGLVGGRLYHVMTDWQRYFGAGNDPLDVVRIWDGGLGIWGAIALGAVGAWIACRRRGIPLPAVADAVAPGIVVAQGIGRLGNYFNQELYGKETSLPWGLEIYQRVDPDNPSRPAGVDGVAVDTTPLAVVHPTFLYELLWCLGVAVLVVWADRRFRLGHGRAFALYVAGYTAGRFWIELLRVDEAWRPVLDVRINVWTATAVFLGAVLYMIVARGRGPREDPALLAPAGAPAEAPAQAAQDSADAEAGTTGADPAGGTAAGEGQDGSPPADEPAGEPEAASGTDEPAPGDQR